MGYKTKYQASIDFFLVYPPELRKELQNIIWNTTEEKRGEIWNKKSIPYEEIENKFKKLTIQRNNFALENGFKSSIDYYLDLYKIPKEDYKNFLGNIDKIIDYANFQLKGVEHKTTNFYNEFSNHCYVCSLNSFPFNNIESVKNYIFGYDELLGKNKNMISIIQDDVSKLVHNTKINKFEIHINKNQNLRHQMVDVIHELAHVKCRLISNTNNKGLFSREFEALTIELELLKSISDSLYNAIFGEFLKVFHRVLFEIELYSNPLQNLAELYAHFFNKCFKCKKQHLNRLYILDELIIQNPLATLPHAVAQATVIKNLL